METGFKPRARAGRDEMLKLLQKGLIIWDLAWISFEMH
jgi:hypothetical protein